MGSKRGLVEEESSSSSTSSDEEELLKAKKKLKKLKKMRKEETTEKLNKKKLKKLKKKIKKEKKKKRKKECKKDKKDAEVKKELDKRHQDKIDTSSTPPIESSSKLRAPMTKEEWEKQESVVRRVVDPESGRSRLVKGSGEILEECVSRQRHLAINKAATKADGDFFQSSLLLKAKKL